MLVGEGASVGEGARIDGPAVIGPGATVGAGAIVKQSVLLAGRRGARRTALLVGAVVRAARPPGRRLRAVEPPVEVLWWRDCPSWERAIELVREEMAAPGSTPERCEVTRDRDRGGRARARGSSARRR